MRVLISWLAFNNDFIDGKATKDGPNFQFHKHFYSHDKHVILSSEQKDDLRLAHLLSLIKKDFPSHDLEGIHLDVSDVINVNGIRAKLESFLQRHKNDEIEAFISPGTPAMQVVWYLIKYFFRHDINLVQVRQSKHTKNKSHPELIKIDLDTSSATYSALVRESDSGSENNDILIVNSLKHIYSMARQVAEADGVTTLILGQSGTGKENLARSIHNWSARKHRPYLTLNCSAFSDSLLESRLFGYMKGAFTGAEKTTTGLLEEANGGTIFLDEIGDVSLQMQQSLLRVLQEKEITPVGGKPKKIDVRIIAATNKDLSELCTQEKFRWDLYYRLSVVELELPSLNRWKQQEIKSLITHFNKIKCLKFKREQMLKIAPPAMNVLLAYSYPGNVRELENLIERFYVFCKETVNPSDIPLRILSPTFGELLKWEDVEREHVRKVLVMCNGNQLMTSEKIGWAINTLKAKMKKYGFELNQFRS